MKKRHQIIAAAVASLFGIASLNAQSVLMLNFGSTAVPGGEATNSPYHTENGSFTGSTWNELGKSDSASLSYADGTTATGIAFDIGRSNPLGSGSTVDYSVEPASSNTLGDQGGIYSLDTMRSTVWTGNNGSDNNWVGGQVTGLAAGTYEVLIWGNLGNTTLGNSPMETYVTAGAAASTFDFDSITGSAISNDNNAAWTDGVSYSKTTITLAANESIYLAIDGTAPPSFSRGFLSGVQVAAIPESSTYAVIAGALGMITVMVRRRRA